MTLAPSVLTLIAGPSGAGKSTLLRALERALKCRGVAVVRLSSIPLPRTRALVDCFALPLAQTMSALAQAGLAEARLFLLPPARLSEGQQFRYRLAQWMADARAPVLLADEFCSNLDRLTARAVAWQCARFVRSAGRTAFLATAHDDLEGDLKPDQILRIALQGEGHHASMYIVETPRHRHRHQSRL